MLVVESENVGSWSLPAVVFERDDLRLTIPVIAPIGNSVATSQPGKNRTAQWKIEVATATKSLRGTTPLDPAWSYSVSVGFAFNEPAHGSQPLDVENFMKPTLDALAAGLFCDASQDVSGIVRFAYDDSNFRYLFVHRLANAATIEEEGAALVVSVRRQNESSAV